jgi:flavin-dependent dehydrogenase
MRSTVARLVRAPMVLEDPTLTCVYYAYWSDLPVRMELYEAPDRFAGIIPTNDGMTVVALYYPQSEFKSVRRNARREYLENIRRIVPALADIPSADDRFGKLYAMGDQRNFFRKAHGPGWVLVGDAAHHKDSITARGISDAFLQVELLAEFMLPHLDDPGDLDEALAAHELECDERLTESYHNTLSVARLEMQNERIRLLKRIERDPVLVDRYFSIVSGVSSVEEVFTPDVLLEAMSLTDTS